MIPKKYAMPWKPTLIYFIGDIQWAGRNNDVALDMLNETIAEALSKEDEGYTVRFIGMGDYTDFASPSNRARITQANLYDNAIATIEDKAVALVHEIYALALKPTTGKWLGVVEGHHLFDLRSGKTTDMELCELLKAPFLGTTGLLRLAFSPPSAPKGKSEIPVTIWFHHGVGNGMTGYYPLTRLEKKSAEWEQVDVFAIGHTTKMAMEFQNKVFPRWRTNDLAHRKVILMGTGGYSKCYVEGAMQGNVPRGGYAERGMMNAAILGSPILKIRPRIFQGNKRVDLTAEA